MSVEPRSVPQDGHGRLGRVLSGLAVAVGCVLFLGGFGLGALLYQPFTVPTDSMTPTLAVGSKILAARVDGADVKRGDIVVFQDVQWGNVTMVKRVVGVGGDTVACCGAGGRLTVNGTPVDEPYLRDAGKAVGTADGQPGSAGAAAPGAEFSAKVPDGSLFLLGDDRHTSMDSRAHLQEAGHGAVPRGAVIGRVDAVAWPAPGALDRPAAFAALPGGTSQPGPVVPLVSAIVAGCVLILAGAAYGPLVRRGGRKKTTGSAAGTAKGRVNA
ncbi:signal peptidase I [Streptomyces sp. NPDC090025]|uniref:signal peptidase I n=1 Tax=Streptomyces sp. NPDC090025 TaxID=3365922 RepID=UPI0038345558